MKNKSTRHKEYNTFKFQPFSERIANVNVDVFHHIGHEYETADGNEGSCHFHEAVEKWDQLNLTEGYRNFKKDADVRGIITLTQFLHHKDRVVQVLVDHLRLKDDLCLQPLLEFVIAIAKDLRADFSQHYTEFFGVLLELLQTKDTDRLEWTFQCLAYVFKFSWRSLIKDIRGVFSLLLPLLSDAYPEYINNFAAESFAFIARKVKDRESFLLLILKAIDKNKNGVNGCGRLLFEVVKGINGNFHSCATTYVPFLLHSLSNPKFLQDYYFEILEQFVANVLGYVQPESCTLFWTSFHEELERCINGQSNSTNKHLQLIGQMVEYKNGRLLKEPTLLINDVNKLIKQPDVTKDVLLSCIKIVVIVLLSNMRLSQESASLLITAAASVKDADVFLYFVRNICDYPAFESLILPTFLQNFVKSKFAEEYLETLSWLILKKAPYSKTGSELSAWRKYSIDVKSSNKELSDYFRKNLESFDDAMYISFLICLPHLKFEFANIADFLVEKFLSDCKTLNNDVRKTLFRMHVTLATLVHLSETSHLCKLGDDILKTVLPLCTDVSYSTALMILDLYLTAVKDVQEIVHLELLATLHDKLRGNFSSPYNVMRLLTIHVYKLFEPFLENWNIFSLCFGIEFERPAVDTYRDQLQLLEKLNHEKLQNTLSTHGNFKDVPLRYMFGVLYINFQLLWEPTITAIASYAFGMQVKEFWPVFLEQISTSVDNSKNPPVPICDECNTPFEHVNELYKTMYTYDDKPDFFNYRLLLWRCMTKFPQISEAKTRDVSPLLLGFVLEEYMRSNSEIATTWNIKQNTHNVSSMDVDEESIEDKTESIKRKVKESTGTHAVNKNFKLLQECLTLFSKFRNPKALYREEEINKLYFDMLAHKHPQIQKLALDCILTYRHKYLTPYQQNLYNLIDDKKFKNELATFYIDKDTSIVQEEHRENLIPIVMQIVYSKMVARTGQKGSLKAGGQFRRNLVLRFLSGCKNEEKMHFMHMAFKYYIKYFTDEVELMVGRVEKDVDLERYVPPKRMQSNLNLLTVILEQFGHLMETDVLRFLLRVLLCIGALLKGAFNNLSEVHAGYLSILKNMRINAIKILERFFDRFENFPWTSKEIDCATNVFVWPQLDKLNIEGIHSPTSLLKLFCLWGSNPRYFPLLVKCEPGKPTNYPLQHVVALLINPKSHASVYNLIMETIEKLLTLTVNEEDVPLPVDNLLPVADYILERLKTTESLNYGSCILLPHIPQILTKFKTKLETRAVNRKELLVLSRISELVWEPDLSDSVLSLLLPLAIKKAQSSEETVVNLVTTLHNLLLNVDEPEKHLRNISPLFGYVGNTPARKLLCAMLSKIKAVQEVVIELNAYDAKWVEQPDYQRRLDAFKGINALCDNGTLTLELGVLIIYNSYYTITENDLSLRENASHCLKTVASYLANNATNKAYLVDDVLFPLIKIGLRSKSADLRNESISLLGHLSRECADAHLVLHDLNKLTNKADLEVDFFENLVHLQSHRHVRALFRFSQIFQNEENSPTVRTLTQFVLPLATHYLCNERYLNKHSLVDAAIDAVGTVCHFLPWHQYENVLKFYLVRLRNKVEFQKQLVKLIVRVLDSFHYDLSKGWLDVDSQSFEKQCTESSVDTKEEMPESLHEEKEEKEVEDTLEEVADYDDEDRNTADDSAKAQKAYGKIQTLCKSAAIRTLKAIQHNLLPQLQNSLAESTAHDGSHKVNRKRTGAEREEEDLLKIPLSLAVVKLLQKLPKTILDLNLRSVFMKLCTFLKAKLESVRRTAREMLQKIMIALGPDYLPLLLGDMATLLTKGFQVHVLVYTMHSVLSCLRDVYKPNHIDKVLLTVLDVCKIDLFGVLSDEKDIAKIVSKTSEAKSTKSYDTFQILAQYVTEKCLMDLILPLKDVLAATHSLKTVTKAQEALRFVVLGLIDNTFIETESLLKFAYGVASESIPQLLPKDQPQMTKKEREHLERRQTDCFIIPKEPTSRLGVKANSVRTNSKVNAHVLIEFGIYLCGMMLKRDKLKEGDYAAYLDPFIVIFKDSLESRHVKLSTASLQCLQRVLKYDLPSLRLNITDIVKLLFGVLHKYAAEGLSKGDNFDLVVAAFKTMSVLLRDVKYHTIQTDQLQMLLLYIEQDLCDHEKQATAFNLLKAIVARKLDSPELHAIMSKVLELSITSELTHVRLQARNVALHYMLEYPLGKKLVPLVDFYLAQLEYELQFGRESALDMIATFIHSFPQNVLKHYSGKFFVTLAARMVNDDVPICRKMAADCLTALITKATKKEREELFDIVQSWFRDKLNHRKLAAQMCGVFVTVQKASFIPKLERLIPLLLLQFDVDTEETPGRFVRLQQTEQDSPSERDKDHHLYQVLQTVLKLCAHCPDFLKRTNDIENFSVHAQTLLAHPHEWVRLSAAQFLGFVMSSLDDAKLAELLVANETESGYLYSDPLNGIRSLTLDLCAQLQPGIKSELAEQVIKNLVFIARVLHQTSEDCKINLLWLVKKMRRIVNSEIVENANSTVLRTEVFKWIAGIITLIETDQLKPILGHLLAPLVREMITTEENNTQLRQLAKEVAILFKKRIGVDAYTQLLSDLQRRLSVKRAERKRTRNQLAVTDPEMYAKKKIKLNEKKKEAKKRKINSIKGTAGFRKKKKKEKDVNLEDHDEIM